MAMRLPKSGRSGSSTRRKGKNSGFRNENGKKNGELRSENGAKNDRVSGERALTPGTKIATLFQFLARGTPSERRAALFAAK
jgi:hypothetical protein